jgi:hypothetical protein
MESEYALKCPQNSTTDTYPEPDESSPYNIISFVLRYIFHLPSVLYDTDFPTKTFYAFLFRPMCDTCPHQLILFDLTIRIIHGEVYKLRTSS